MSNPWLNISAADYEGHMSCPEVNQLSFLGTIFKEALEKHDCSSVAFLGCATGNGLEYVNNDDTQELTVVDINPEYLEVLERRYKGRINGLRVVVDDLKECCLPEQNYSLIFAGLIFEFLEPRALLNNIVKWLRINAALIVVLQLPSENMSEVSQSPYASLKTLNTIVELVVPERFRGYCTDAGLEEVGRHEIRLETGKSFYIGTFKRRNE